MAISKLILNGEVQMDVTSDTVEANKLLSGETATKNDGTKVTGTFVAPDPVISALSVTPTESAQTFNDASISGYKPVTVGAIASDYIGSAIPLKSSTDIQHYGGGLIVVPKGYYSKQADYTMSQADISIYATLYSDSGYISYGYKVLQGNEGYAFGGYGTGRQLPTLSAQTITPTESVQYISSYQWLTGSLTIAGISLMSKTVDPSESIQVITANNILVDEQNKSGSARASSVSIVIDSLSSLESGKTYHIIGSATAKRNNNPSAEAAITFDTDWIYGTDIPFEASVANLVTSIVINSNYIAFRFSSTGDNSVYYLNLQIYEKGYDGLSQVTVNAIPSSYIIPSGTYSVTENGTYDIGSYASVDVSVAGGEFYDVYKAIALNSQKLSYGISSFSEWLSTVSTAYTEMLMNRNFDSNTTYTFSNLTEVPIRFYARYPYSSSAYYSQRYANERFIFEKATAFAIQAFYSRAQVVEISAPECSMIAQSAFNFCRDLSIVSFPKVSVIYSYGFANCISLKSVNFPLCSTIWDYAFSNCTGLTTASFPSCTLISHHAFYGCKMLRSISFPVCSSITTSAFYNCSSLETLYLPACKYLDSQTFGNCASVTTADFPVLRGISTATFSSCIALSEISCPELVQVYDFGFQNCKALKSVYFPKCTRIERYAFQSCTALETVDFPICSTIDYWAFSNCSNLKNISFPSCVTVGEYAFCSCTALEKAVLPSCQKISSYAFESCFSLSYVDIPICSIISKYAFYSCSALATIYAPSLKTIGTSAFRRCLSLSSISFPSLESIDGYAFDFCNSLMSVYLFGSSMPSISTTDIFRETPIINSVNNVYGSIYVPASLYDSYISAPNWSYYKNRIVGLSFNTLTDETVSAIDPGTEYTWTMATLSYNSFITCSKLRVTINNEDIGIFDRKQVDGEYGYGAYGEIPSQATAPVGLHTTSEWNDVIFVDGKTFPDGSAINVKLEEVIYAFPQ